MAARRRPVAQTGIAQPTPPLRKPSGWIMPAPTRTTRPCKINPGRNGIETVTRPSKPANKVSRKSTSNCRFDWVSHVTAPPAAPRLSLTVAWKSTSGVASSSNPSMCVTTRFGLSKDTKRLVKWIGPSELWIRSSSGSYRLGARPKGSSAPPRIVLELMKRPKAAEGAAHHPRTRPVIRRNPQQPVKRSAPQEAHRGRAVTNLRLIRDFWLARPINRRTHFSSLLPLEAHQRV